MKSKNKSLFLSIIFVLFWAAVSFCYAADDLPTIMHGDVSFNTNGGNYYGGFTGNEAIVNNNINFMSGFNVKPLVVSTDINANGWAPKFTYGSNNFQLNDPRGVYYDGSTYLYIADTGNNRIVRTRIDGSEWDVIGGPAAGSGQWEFNSPEGITAVGGSIYVADTGNNRVVRTNINRTEWQSALGAFSRPKGLTVCGTKLYAANQGSGRISLNLSSGTMSQTSTWTGLAGSLFNSPEDVFCSASDTTRIYVADTAKNRIVRAVYNTAIAGNWQTLGDNTTDPANAKFNQPRGISYDGSNYIYIADAGNNRVIKTKINGDGWQTLGDVGVGTVRFNSPQKIFNYGGDKFFVTSLHSSNDLLNCILDPNTIINPTESCFSLDPTSSMKLLKGSTLVNNTFATEIAALGYPGVSIIGDVYSGGADFSNFALYGRNLAKSSTGGINPSDGTWNMTSYAMNTQAQAYYIAGSASQKYFDNHYAQLKGEAVDTGVYSYNNGTVWDMQGPTFYADLGDETNKYPEGKVWYAKQPTHVNVAAGVPAQIPVQGKGTLIVNGNLTLDPGTKIYTGSSASDSPVGLIVLGDLVLNDNSQLEAAVFCTGTIKIGNNVKMKGSFVASDFKDASGGSLDDGYGITITYDYRLEDHWPPGFRYFDMPSPENTAP